MLFKKETTNASLLAAIDGGSVDNFLKGGSLVHRKINFWYIRAG